MGLFDKDKLKSMASGAASKMKDMVDEAQKEAQRKKELGILPNATVTGVEYQGGHPDLSKTKACNLSITNEKIDINYGFSSGTINFEDITGIRQETTEQISHRITATRLVALGPFALAFKKKQKSVEKYLTIDYSDRAMENTVVIGGKNVPEAYAKLYERYQNFCMRRDMNYECGQPCDGPISNGSDPYEELKKAKELLDMGIISQDEFDQKKKELLNL